MFVPRKLSAAACVLALGLGATTAQAGGLVSAGPVHGHPRHSDRLPILDRPAKRFGHSIRAWSRSHQTGSAAGAYPPPEAFGVSSQTLDAIGACESGGDPTAVSAAGTYRGKYQFDYGTWASVGGTGDPAAAPVAEQDMRAAMLYARAGTSPWPICG